MVKAIIFDLDDTLISEGKYIESGYRHIAKILRAELGIVEENIFSELMDLFNKNSKNVFNRLLDRHGIDYSNDKIFDIVEEYRNHLPNIKFFYDVLPCLEMIKSRNIKIGIITDGYSNAQRQKLKAIKAYEYFDEIIITDSLGREFWKPHPKAFEVMKNKLDIEFNEMIYVGDNPEKDFYIGNIHPIMTVRICRGGIYENSNYFNNVKENYKFINLVEMMKIL